MLLPIDRNDPIGLFQAEFRVTSFTVNIHNDRGAIYDSIDLLLADGSGQFATASLVIISDEKPGSGSFDPEAAAFRLNADEATGNRLLDLLFRAGACSSSGIVLGVQYDPDYKIDDFWARISVVLSGGGVLH